MSTAPTTTTDPDDARALARFRMDIARQLRTTDDWRAMIAIVSQALGERLGADRVGYAELRDGRIVVRRGWRSDGAAPSVAADTLADWGDDVAAALAAGRPVQVDDADTTLWSAAFVQRMAAAGARAALLVPLLGGDRLLAVLFATARQPRRWTDDELLLIEEVAGTTWSAIELARATARAEAAREAIELSQAAGDVGSWTVDNGSGRVLWSDTTRAMFGLAPHDPIDRGVYVHALHPDDRARVADAMARSAAERWPAYEQEFRIVRPDGSVRWLLSRGRRAGESRMDGVVIDITARKEAEERLAEARARLAFAQAAGGVGSWEWSPTAAVASATSDGKPDGQGWWSDESFRLWGFEPGPVPAFDRLIERVHPDDRAAFVAARTAAPRGVGAGFEQEFRIRLPDGVVRWLSSRARVVPEPGGGIRVVGVNIDITARREAEEAARQAAAQVSVLVEGAPALIFAMDADARNILVNQRYADYTGGEERLLGHAYRELIHPDDRETVATAAARRLDGGRSFEMRLRLRRHDGAWRWFLIRGEVLAGGPFHLLGVGIDIDEQVRAEERERLLMQEVDHRARNMLAVVQSVVSLTRAEDVRGLKAAIEGRIAALARAHGLIAASRWDGACLCRLVEEELAPFAGAAVRIDGAPLLLQPPMAQGLALVLHELATNAAKHGALSTPSGHLMVGWSVEDGRLHLAWRERSGPPATAPSRRGFGSTVLAATIERQLGGRLALDWGGEGLTAELSVPLTAGGAVGPSRPDPSEVTSR